MKPKFIVMDKARGLFLATYRPTLTVFLTRDIEEAKRYRTIYQARKAIAQTKLQGEFTVEEYEEVV